MKALILSCNMGGGHNSAGRAICGELQRRGIEFELTDALQFAGEKISKKLCGAYIGMTTKTPWFFHFIYSAGAFISNPRHKSVVYGLNALYKEKVYDYITENGFDTVIMPHIFPAQTLTALKKKLNVKTIAIATDYTCSPFWEETDLDGLVIPHKDLAAEFISKGLKPEKLLPFGIPVDSSFSKRSDKKETRLKLSLPVDKKMVLVMSGSMGYGNLDKLTELLLRHYGDTVTIVLLGGNNEKLKSGLRKKYAGNGNLYVVDFTDKVSLYMDACDVLLTKPGGLTSTEAAAKRIPLILTNPIPGCETQNAKFFEQHGLALCADTPQKQLEHTIFLLDSEGQAERMAQAQRENINAFSASDIVDHILSY